MPAFLLLNDAVLFKNFAAPLAVYDVFNFTSCQFEQIRMEQSGVITQLKLLSSQKNVDKAFETLVYLKSCAGFVREDVKVIQYLKRDTKTEDI